MLGENKTVKYFVNLQPLTLMVNSMVEIISLHDQEGLESEFARIKKPGSNLIQALDSLTRDVSEADIIPFKFRFFENFIKKKAINNRVHAAAWELARPSSPKKWPSLDDMRIRLKLSDEFPTARDFSLVLIQELDEIMQKHKALSRWIQSVLAEIEFDLSKNDYSESETCRAAMTDLEVFHRLLLRASFSRDQTPEPTRIILGRSLECAAAVFTKVVAPKNRSETPASANLMMPFQKKKYINFLSNLPAAEKANEIWKGINLWDAHQFFVVIADTRENEYPSKSTYLGFWVPDIRYNSVAIPGAPTAWMYKKATAVFVDDLPKLQGVNKVVVAQWENYMKCGTPDSFSGTVFISVPIVAQLHVAGPTKPIAILNINFHTDRIWPRLLSERWVTHAANKIAPFLIPILHAAILEVPKIKGIDFNLPNVYDFYSDQKLIGDAQDDSEK